MKKSKSVDFMKDIMHGIVKLGIALSIGSALALSINAMNDDSTLKPMSVSESDDLTPEENRFASSYEGERTESDDDSIEAWVNDVVASATRLVQDALGNGSLLVNGLSTFQDVETGASTPASINDTVSLSVTSQDTTTGATGKTVTITTYAPDGTPVTTIIAVSGDGDEDDDDDYYEKEDDDDDDDDDFDEKDDDDDEEEDDEEDDDRE